MSLFFFFFFPFFSLFLLIFLCSELPLYFPSEGRGLRGREDGILWLASFLPIMAQILYIYSSKQTKIAKKQTSAVCCMPGNCKREGRGGSCSNVSLVSLSLPRTHTHTHTHTRTTTPPPPTESPLPPPPAVRGRNLGLSPRGPPIPRGCAVTLRRDAMVFFFGGHPHFPTKSNTQIYRKRRKKRKKKKKATGHLSLTAL